MALPLRALLVAGILAAALPLLLFCPAGNLHRNVQRLTFSSHNARMQVGVR